MTFPEVELPSNRKFGFFFTSVFAVLGIYSFYAAMIYWAYAFAFISVIFLIVTLVKADILLPLNILWMRLGFLLGRIVSPVILGLIFFGIFTPIAVITRIIGRDELSLKLMKKPSYWILRSKSVKSEFFKNQF
jgi:hypothetical protein